MKKVGDYLICINAFDYNFITVGRRYFVHDSYRSYDGCIYYRINNDDGFCGPYEAECFMDIKDERSEKLNKIRMKYEVNMY